MKSAKAQKHTHNCGQTGPAGVLGPVCKKDCECWCHLVKFMVISYDNDQQVPYADAVMAAGPEQARAIIDDIRPNCVSVIALDADDLQTWKKDLDGRRETTIVRWMAASKKAAQS